MHRYTAALAALIPILLLVAGQGEASPQAGRAEDPAAVAAGAGGEGPPAIPWREFDSGILQAAAAEDRLILLYVTAPWEYHDHVMSEVTYADPEVVKVVNEHFIPVKVHTDHRPDLFARYGQGAWPTTSVILPDGLPFFHPSEDGSAAKRAGGTFYPPGRFSSYFRQLAEYYAENGEMVRNVSSQIADTLLQRKNVDRGEVRGEALEVVIGKLLDTYGSRPAGLAREDTYPDFSMVDLAYYYWFRRADREVLDLGLHHLTDIARGGIHDRLGGGFFRYSRDNLFRVPSFEKLPSTNALAIRAYLGAYQVSGNGIFLRLAEGAIRHVLEHGWSDSTRSFLGARAAWSGADGGLDYYTWTRDEVRALLTEEEFKIASAAYDLGETGELASVAPRRNVIYMSRGPKLLAQVFEGTDAGSAARILDRVNEKLIAARAKRPGPEVDPSTYGNWSGMMASAFLHASLTLKRADLAEKAIGALETLQARCSDERGLVSHVCRPDKDRRGRELFLSDQVRVAAALLDAYQATGDRRHLDRARILLDMTLVRFRDSLSGGFNDRPSGGDTSGLLAWPVRDLDEEMVLVESLLRLHHLTGAEGYRVAARKALEAWADEFGELGVAAAPYALASQKYLNPPLEILVVEDPGETGMEGMRRAASRLYHPWKVVRHYALEDGRQALASERGLEAREGAQIAFCYEKECTGPFGPDEPLRDRLRAFMNRGAGSGSGEGR